MGMKTSTYYLKKEGILNKARTSFKKSENEMIFLSSYNL